MSVCGSHVRGPKWTRVDIDTRDPLLHRGPQRYRRVPQSGSAIRRGRSYIRLVVIGYENGPPSIFADAQKGTPVKPEHIVTRVNDLRVRRVRRCWF